MQDFTHLILLIGTNPLPNYVVARYFLEKLKTISLVYTEQTAGIAQHLIELLQKEKPALHFNYCDLTAPGDADQIRHEIRKKIPLKFGEPFHLNYTGGTKNMSVQSYLALFVAYADIKTGNSSFSYLDAEDFTLKYDDGLTSSVKDLRPKINIAFDDLLALHDCKSEAAGSKPNWEAANQEMQEFIVSEKQKLLHDFIAWKNAKIRKLFYFDNKLRLPARVTKQEVGWEDSPEKSAKPPLQKLLDAFPPAQAWQFDAGEALIIPDSKADFKNGDGDFVKGVKYLDGDWLEYYVQNALERKNRETHGRFQILRNHHIKKGKAGKDFEIDLLLLYGYQLCGISITTAGEGHSKSKAFEILHRSQQIGGDEARSVLVTTQPYDVVQKMADDLKMDIGRDKPQLLILGAGDLPPDKLWEKIKTHIVGV